MVSDEKLGVQAKSNTIDNFKFGFEDVFIAKLIDRMDQNQDIFNKIMDDKAFSSVVKDYLIKKVYKRLNAQEEGGAVKIDVDQDTLFFSDVIPDENMTSKYKYSTHLPVYSLQAVATAFSEEQKAELLGWKKIDARKNLDKHMFIAQVIGKSMEPTITSGSFCIFRYDQGGSRNGKVVLVESHQVTDPETYQKFTVKRYRSEKEKLEDDQWRQKKIILSPDNKKFKDIVLENVSGDDFRVVAEFICTV